MWKDTGVVVDLLLPPPHSWQEPHVQPVLRSADSRGSSCSRLPRECDVLEEDIARTAPEAERVFVDRSRLDSAQSIR